MLDAGRERGWEIVPTFFANHRPTTGLITADAFDDDPSTSWSSR